MKSVTLYYSILKQPTYDQNMPVINFILADGSQHAINGSIGTSVMLLAKKNEFSGILAECGGACCCATCHVHVDQQWIARLPKMEEGEQDILEFAEGVDEMSRLSCQIKITNQLDGLVVHVPETQF